MEKTMDKIVAVAKSTAAWQIPGITARSVLS